MAYYSLQKIIPCSQSIIIIIVVLLLSLLLLNDWSALQY